MIHRSQVKEDFRSNFIEKQKTIRFYLELGNSIPNGINGDTSDGASNYGTIRSAPTSGWINALAGGGGGGGAASGVGGQSTLSRKSGKTSFNL